MDVSAHTAVALWDILGLQVSLDMGSDLGMQRLPVRDGTSAVKAHLYENSEAGLLACDRYPDFVPSVISLELLEPPPHASAPASSKASSAPSDDKTRRKGLLPKLSFISMPKEDEDDLSSQDQTMQSISEGFDLDITKFSMHPLPSSDRGGSGGGGNGRGGADNVTMVECVGLPEAAAENEFGFGDLNGRVGKVVAFHDASNMFELEIQGIKESVLLPQENVFPVSTGADLKSEIMIDDDDDNDDKKGDASGQCGSCGKGGKGGDGGRGSSGGGEGGGAWRLWSGKRAAASAARGVMHLDELGVTRVEATLERVEKYKARGFRLVSDGSAKQQRLFKKTMAGCCRLSEAVSIPQHTEYDVIIGSPAPKLGAKQGTKQGAAARPGAKPAHSKEKPHLPPSVTSGSFSLGAEPTAGEADSTRIQLRLASGETVVRRFLLKDTVATLFAVVVHLVSGVAHICRARADVCFLPFLFRFVQAPPVE
jgi:hypothetical protein